MPNAQDAELENLVRQFAQQIQMLTARRMQETVMAVLGGAAPRRRGRPPGSKNSAKASPVVRRRPRLSPAVLKARRLQGKYMGTLRGLNPGDHARVKAVAKEKGVAEAVRLAATLSGDK